MTSDGLLDQVCSKLFELDKKVWLGMLAMFYSKQISCLLRGYLWNDVRLMKGNLCSSEFVTEFVIKKRRYCRELGKHVLFRGAIMSAELAQGICGEP